MKPLKTRAREWIKSLFKEYSLNLAEGTIMPSSFYFKLVGFADEPEVYLRLTMGGYEFGYKTIQWEGHLPSEFLAVHKKYFLSWENLKLMSKEEQQEMVLELLMKTISSRKRQYRKCQFCGEEVALEHRFDKSTCHGCASEHYHVIY